MRRNIIKYFRRAASVFLLAIIILIVFQFPASTVQAGTQNSNMEDLVNGADCIIIGTVVESTSYWNGEHTGIYTSSIVAVEAEFKSAIGQDRITVTLPGGVVDGIGQWVSGQPAFNRGEQAMIFLKEMAVTGLPQVQDSGRPSLEGQFGIFGGCRGKLTINQGKIGDIPVAEFKNSLHNKLEGQAASFKELDSSLALVTMSYSYAGYSWAHPPSPVVNYRIHENTTDCTGEAVAIQAAAATWNAAGANFTFSYSGPTSATSAGYDGINEIMWRNLGSGGIVAQTSIWYNVNTNLIMECDMEFNDYYYFCTDMTYGFDVQTVALHELGHFLCLDDLYNSADSAKVMYGYCSQVPSTKRVLHSDDIAGIRYIYGASLVSISITPENPTIISGRTQQFTATGNYSDSSTLDLTSSVTWSSNNTGVATIGAHTGTAQGISSGQTAINAAFSGKSADATLTVLLYTLQITTNSLLPDGQVGVAYYQILNVTGGIAPYIWSIQGTPVLPSGLTLDANTGIISGQPAVAGGPVTITVRVSDRYSVTGTSELSITINKISTTVGLISSSNPEVVGRQVTFTASVEANMPDTGIPGGPVTFKDGETIIGAGLLNTEGQASFSLTSLQVGSHSIEAFYTGDASFSASTATVLFQNIVMRCDVNEDGSVNMGDVVKIERMILGLDSPTSPADANFDNDVDMGDVVELERTILGLSNFPNS